MEISSFNKKQFTSVWDTGMTLSTAQYSLQNGNVIENANAIYKTVSYWMWRDWIRSIRMQLLKRVFAITNEQFPAACVLSLKNGRLLRLQYFYSNFTEAPQPQLLLYSCFCFVPHCARFPPFSCQPPPEGWCFDTKLRMSLIPVKCQIKR